MAGFSSAYDTLRAMQREINRMPMALRNRISVAVKDEINVLLGEQFDGGFGPDGQAWQPVKQATLKRRKVSTSPTPLTDTGAMRKSVRAVRVGTNVAIESELPAAYHQAGGGHLPKRAIWPEPNGPLPERYETRLALVANTVALEVLRSPVLSAAE